VGRGRRRCAKYVSMRSRLLLIALCAVGTACQSAAPAPDARAGARSEGAGGAVAAGLSAQGGSPKNAPAPIVDAADPAPVPPRQRLKTRRSGSQVVVETQAKWAARCAIHRKCTVATPALARCDAQRIATPWTTLAENAERSAESQLAVSGRLVLDDSVFSTAAACAAGQCCNHVSVRAVLEGPVVDVELVGLGCVGDESRLCCNVPAEGQLVVATGRLRRSEATKTWQLVDANLCVMAD
jgi:hypothetical protein